MWIILLNKGYVLMWIFREPPSPLGHPHGLWMFPNLTLPNPTCQCLITSSTDFLNLFL